MKRSLLVLALLAFAAPVVMACINAYGTSLNGQTVMTVFESGDDLVDYLTKHEGRWHWRLEKARLGRNLEKAPLEQRNDYAAALLHLGEIKPALAILVKIEQERPGLYATATNLGTGYELAGKNEHALSWIRSGIRRNPNSHEGTEWLHVAVLQAKLALANDPRWLHSHSVLGLDFGSAALPRMPARFPPTNTGTRGDAVSTRSAIHRQLYERIQFVAARDPIVGDLLFDYANLIMLTDVLENAEAIYKEALRYGTTHDDLVRKRLAHTQNILARAKKKP
jgi:tetratricopeptide (TPR) repeat protein